MIKIKIKKILGINIFFSALFGFFSPVFVVAQSTLPLVQQGHLQYLGGFRVPGASNNGVDFSYGGGPVTYNPANNSLFVGSRNYIAEISIPTLGNSTDAKQLPMSSYIQGFYDPTEGHITDMSRSTVELGGLLVSNNRLYGTAYIYYDATYSQRVSHFSRSLQLNQSSFSGWSQVWNATSQGFVAGNMSLIPSEWQTALGGPAMTGQCCLSIITRTSFGPAAFAFNPIEIGQSTVSAVPLLYYDALHPTLGEWGASNSTYGATSKVGGMVIIPGTRTALFIGRNGHGSYCYGDGVSDPALANGVTTCYDPTGAAKGQHAYPYQYQIWAYDLNDFVSVKNGTKQPWEILPYNVWQITFPTNSSVVHIGGIGYDTERQILYISQRDANKGNFSASPVIHAFKMNIGVSVPYSSSSVPTPVPTPTPTPAPTPTPPSITPLRGDINLDHAVNALDWSIMNAVWFTTNAESDLNGDGLVNSLDFATLSSRWGMTW